MTEQELIDVWHKEFEDYLNKTHEDKSHRLIMWVTWLAAKRSQPVVELPHKSNPQFADFYTNGYNDAIEACMVALTASGIQFKVEE